MGIEQLYGTWRLVRFGRIAAATGERSEDFGKHPSGYLTYTRDGRMIAVLVKEGRKKFADLSKATDAERAELFNGVVAYAGKFTLDGNRVTHHVDVSWNETWTGTEQIRNITLEGRKLFIRSEPRASGYDGKLVTAEIEWEKVE